MELQKRQPAGKKSGRIERYMLSVIEGRQGLVASAIRLFLLCLVPLYCAGLEIYLLPYTVGIRKRHRLKRPVICIGNLTTGGTGKTPVTQKVCRILAARGLRPAVLSRGYGGENEYGCAIASDGHAVLLTAAQAGDEAYLLASSLPGVPVLVGKDRRITGELAIAKFDPDVIIMDDGMQFWQLYRDFDIVLVNASLPFDNGYTFPRGKLREPKYHLKRAGLIVITGASQVNAQQDAANAIRRISPGTPLLTSRLIPTSLLGLVDKVEYSVSWLKNRSVASVCAIGNPHSFEAILSEQGATLTSKFRFRDHQAVTVDELDRLSREAAHSSAEALVTTEKDAVRMEFPAWGLPVYALRVEMQFDSQAEFAAILDAVVNRREYNTSNA